MDNRGKRLLLVTALAYFCLLAGPMAGAQTASSADPRLGIAVFPGAELLTLHGPVPELVDLQRPGWEFVVAEVTVADFLVDRPITELRRFYSAICTRDRTLLLVKKESPDDEIVAVRHAGRHPLHPRKRWLRITTYRRQPGGSP